MDFHIESVGSWQMSGNFNLVSSNNRTRFCHARLSSMEGILNQLHEVLHSISVSPASKPPMWFQIHLHRGHFGLGQCQVQAGQVFPLTSRVELGPEVTLQSQASSFYPPDCGPLYSQSSVTCHSYCSTEKHESKGRFWFLGYLQNCVTFLKHR